MEEVLGISYKQYTYQNKTVGKYRLFRYADDFLVFVKTKEDIMKVPKQLENYLKKHELILSEEKSKITHLSEGFDFLGFDFRQYPDNISRVKVSKDSLNKFKQEVDYYL